MSTYEYTPCKENESQYDDYDLSQTTSVDAIYVHALVGSDSGNEYIEALPHPRDDEAVFRAYQHPMLTYHYGDIANMTNMEKMAQIDLLRDVRIPLPFQRGLEYQMYSALVTSYRSRKQRSCLLDSIDYTANNQKQSSPCVLAGDPAMATNAGFSLIGFSGCGKSSAISILVSHYPQVIWHYDDQGGRYPQIVYIVVNCSANSNFQSLYHDIALQVDIALGNGTPVYVTEVDKSTRLASKAEKIRELVEKFAIGIIILDEIQLLNFGSVKENSFDSILTLTNRTKVAIAAVGTEDAREKMFPELRTARRVGVVINANDYCYDKSFFAYMVKKIYEYQWFDSLIAPDAEMIDALYDVTKGIVDQLISIHISMNVEYLRRKHRPTVNADYVYEIAAKYYPNMQILLSDMKKKGSFSQLSENIAYTKMESFIAAATQEEAAQKIMNHGSTLAGEECLLKNIVTTIRTLHDEYSEDSIKHAFDIVWKNAGNPASIGEQELCREVFAKLNTFSKKTIKSKKKIPDPDTTQLTDFLGMEIERKKQQN